MARTVGFMVTVLCVAALGGEAFAQTCSPPCREGYTCVSGVCQALCNPPCPAGTRCVDGLRCEAIAVPCNPPCPAGTRCVDGLRCEPEAFTCNPPCREGFVCSNGQCVAAPGGPAAPATPGTPASPTTPTGGTTPAPAPPTTPDEAEPEADGPETPRLTLAKLRFGFGGGISDEARDDLIPTIGIAIEHDWAVRVEQVGISFGLMLSGLWWNTDSASEAEIGRSLLLELDVVPKVSYRLRPGLFLYGTVPVGITVSILSGEIVGGAGSDVGFGWNLSVLVGAQYATELVGLFAELGVDIHNFSNSADAALGAGSVDVDIDFTQFALNLGVAF